MEIFVDGLRQRVAEQATVAEVLRQLGESESHALVELNGVYLHRATFASTVLKPDDRLEVIYPAFGG